MKKAYGAIIAALLLVAFQARAQVNFRPGYIVRLSGDTVRGQVDYRGALRSTRLCQFRSAPDAVVQAFRPAELIGYGFPGQKEYRTCLTPLPDSLERPQLPRRFFLEILVSGPASLYARRDEADATHYYLQKGAGTAAPVAVLLHQRRVVESDGSSVLRETNSFRGTLAEAFADCPAVLPEVAQTLFKPSALEGIVKRYNQCRQPIAAAPARKAGARFGLGILAGGQLSQLVFKGENEQAKGSFWAKPAPVVGLALYFTSPALNEHLMLRLEAVYAAQHFEAEYPFSTPGFPQATGQARYQVSHLSLPLIVRYTAPRGWLRPVAELGLAVNAVVQVESGQRIRYVNSLPFGDWQPAFDEKEELRRLGASVLVGLGAQLPWPTNRPLALMGRAAWGSGFTSAAGLESHIWHYSVLLSMNLTK